MSEHGKGGKGLGKGLSTHLILQTRHIMAKNTIRNQVLIFTVRFLSLLCNLVSVHAIAALCV